MMRLLLVLVSLLVVFCAPPAKEESPARFVIIGASVLDGDGGAARFVNVHVEGDTITAVDETEPADGVETIDATGLTLAPGFIDTHSHGDSDLSLHRDALAAVSQGITTIVGGQDGGSPFPLAEFFESLDAEPAAVNIAAYAGHGQLRQEVMGDDFRRAATEEEVEAMRLMLSEEMKAGALGLGSGLEYDPGIYSETSEVVALAREAAAWGGRYISHIRSEDRYFWDAVDEIITIGREANLPVQISHLKIAMVSEWGQAGRLIDTLEKARASGVNITADIYPYPYWQSTLTVMFPERNFDDPVAAQFAVTEISTPEGMLIPTYKPEPSYEGKTLAEISEIRGTEPAETLMELIRDAEALRAAGEEGVESVIATSMDERDIERLMAWRHTNICTDGELDGAHPRGYGTYPRVLGRYVRERDVLTLPDAIHKSTALAAEHMGFADRGRIEPGFKADLVLFDADAVIDRATPQDPRAVSEGIDKVWVNGVLVYTGGRTTGEHPGRVLKRE
ncbi:MAG: D-aminoacylase [Acidobacteria bacterium]|nr:MAG: D-aminoacylase [Acidobacteriota bacterium]